MRNICKRLHPFLKLKNDYNKLKQIALQITEAPYAHEFS